MAQTTRDAPQWVRCGTCWTVYEPQRNVSDACPNCGNRSWVRANGPDRSIGGSKRG